MRIAVDCRSLQEPNPSGVAWYTFFQLKHLIQSAPQHEFDLCILSHYPEGALLARAQKEFTGSNVHWRLTRAPKRFVTFATTLGVWRSWKKLFGDCDVLWMPNLHFVPRTPAPFPVILTVHDLSYERYAEYLTIKGRFWHRILSTMVARANHIVCVSQSTVRELADVYRIPSDRCTVVYPGIEQQPSAEHEFPHNPCIVCVSTIEPRKNIDALVDAYVRIRAVYPSAQCVVVGKPGFHSQKTIQHMRESGVTYRGYVTEEEKENIYAHATAMVYPSIYEGFGLPPLEAQARGVPVIASSVTSLPEVLGDSAVLCDPNDVRSLSNALSSVIADRGYAQTLQKKGYANVQRFTWSRSAQKLLSIVESYS